MKVPEAIRALHARLLVVEAALRADQAEARRLAEAVNRGGRLQDGVVVLHEGTVTGVDAGPPVTVDVDDVKGGTVVGVVCTDQYAATAAVDDHVLLHYWGGGRWYAVGSVPAP